MATSKQPGGHLRRPRANLAPTSRQPRANLAPTSRQPRANLTGANPKDNSSTPTMTMHGVWHKASPPVSGDGDPTQNAMKLLLWCAQEGATPRAYFRIFYDSKTNPSIASKNSDHDSRNVPYAALSAHTSSSTPLSAPPGDSLDCARRPGIYWVKYWSDCQKLTPRKIISYVGISSQSQSLLHHH